MKAKKTIERRWLQSALDTAAKTTLPWTGNRAAFRCAAAGRS